MKNEISSPITINLNHNEINESFIGQFGAVVKLLLRRMFGSDSIIPAGTVKGTPSQISSFEGALVANKRYIDSYISNGLNNPATYKSRVTLDNAVRNFERQTNISWPFR